MAEPREICRAYRVPPNLKAHLLRVAAVGEWICDNWTGPAIARDRIKRALLLHDIGNIVKADYERNPGLFPEEMRNLRYWIAIQSHVRTRYGESDTKASGAIAREVGVAEEVLRLMEEKQFLRNIETAAAPDWERKIAAYADQRVSPYGVVGLDQRLQEARERYREVPTASVNANQFDALVAAGKQIEEQIARHCRRPLMALSDAEIAPYVDQLRTEKLFMNHGRS